jgi:tRNA G10  N-methylase Trm11
MDIDIQNFKPSNDFVESQYSNFFGLAAIIGQNVSDAKKSKKAAANALEQVKQERAIKDAELDAKVEEKRLANEKAEKELQEAQKAAKVQSDAAKVIADQKEEGDSIVKKAMIKKVLIGGGVLAAIIVAVVIFKK